MALPPHPLPIPVTYDADTVERYTYDGSGALVQVYSASSTLIDEGLGDYAIGAPVTPGALKSAYVYDLMGRQTRQTDYTGDGATNPTGIAYQRSVTYNAKGQDQADIVVQLQGASTTTTTTYDYGTGAGYGLGAVVSQVVSTIGQPTLTIANTLAWYNGAVTLATSYEPTGAGSYATSYEYDAAGTLIDIDVGGQRSHGVILDNDTSGQVLRRDESTTSAAAPHEIWYRFDGRQLGYLGNNGTLETDYQVSIANREQAAGTGAYRNGQASGSTVAQFGTAYTPITSYAQGTTAGTYTVHAGDTLEAIAAQMWGDANLWYVLAQANGLSGNATLMAGQVLDVPAGVSRSSNTASTFKPYDPKEALGDTTPIQPQPAQPKKKGCGIFGQILLAVISAVITVVVPGPGGIIGSFLYGAAVNLATQAIGVGLGIEDKINWTGVATAGLTAGLTAGIGNLGPIAGSPFLGDVVTGAVTNAAVQGIAVATGLQDSFDWAGVAAAGIGAGAGGAVGGALHVQTLAANGSFGNVAANLGRSMASTIAEAATRSVIDGTDFGDNILASLPDVVGQTIGGLFAPPPMQSELLADPGPGQAPDAADAILAGQDQLFAEIDQTYGLPGGAGEADAAGDATLQAQYRENQAEDAYPPDTRFLISPADLDDGQAAAAVPIGNMGQRDENGDIVVTGQRDKSETFWDWLKGGATSAVHWFEGLFQGSPSSNGNSTITLAVRISQDTRPHQSTDTTALWRQYYLNAPQVGQQYNPAMHLPDGVWPGAERTITTMPFAVGGSSDSTFTGLASAAYSIPSGSRAGVTGASPSINLGLVSTAYELTVPKLVDVTGKLLTNTWEGREMAERVTKASEFGGPVIDSVEAYNTYNEDREAGHSPLSSAVGTAGSTFVPMLSGAATGFSVGLFAGDGVGAIPGTIVGGVIGYKYGGKINSSGITATEYFESGRATNDALSVKDDTGMSLSQYLDNKFGYHGNHK